MAPKSSKAKGKATDSSTHSEYVARLMEEAHVLPDIPSEFKEFVEKTRLAVRLWKTGEHSRSDDLCHEILSTPGMPFEMSSWANLVIALNAQSSCLLGHAEKAVRIHYHLRGAFPGYSPYAARFELAKKILVLAKSDLADYTARQSEREKTKGDDASGENEEGVKWNKVRVGSALTAMTLLQ